MLLWLNESEATLARFNICCEEAGLSGWLNSIWQFRRLSQASNYVQFTEWLARCTEVRKDAGFEHTSASCFHHFSVSTWKAYTDDRLFTPLSLQLTKKQMSKYIFFLPWKLELHESDVILTYDRCSSHTVTLTLLWIHYNVIVCSDNSIWQHLQLWYESNSLQLVVFVLLPYIWSTCVYTV